MNGSPTYSDTELFALCDRGADAAAWDEFVARFNRKIVGYVIRERRARGVNSGRDEADAVGDLTQ